MSIEGLHYEKLSIKKLKVERFGGDADGKDDEDEEKESAAVFLQKRGQNRH